MKINYSWLLLKENKEQKYYSQCSDFFLSEELISTDSPINHFPFWYLGSYIAFKDPSSCDIIPYNYEQ